MTSGKGLTAPDLLGDGGEMPQKGWEQKRRAPLEPQRGLFEHLLNVHERLRPYKASPADPCFLQPFHLDRPSQRGAQE